MIYDFSKAFGADYSAILHCFLEKKSHIIVTGASGWLGRAVLELFSSLLGDDFHHRVTAYASRQQLIPLTNGGSIAAKPLTEITQHHAQHDVYLFHFAFLTKDKVGGFADDEYIYLNKCIRDDIIALLNQGCVKAIVLSSSGAVYDYLKNSHRDKSANLYGQLKYEDELCFEDFCAIRNIRLIIPRIFNLSGPYINKLDAYALSSIIVNAVDGKDIQIRANKPVFRSYMYILDVLSLCIRMMFSIETGKITRFDTLGDETIEVGELADRVRQVLGMTDLKIDRPELSDSEIDSYLGNPHPIKDIIRNLNFSTTGLNRQIIETAEYIRNLNRDKA